MTNRSSDQESKQGGRGNVNLNAGGDLENTGNIIGGTQNNNSGLVMLGIVLVIVMTIALTIITIAIIYRPQLDPVDEIVEVEVTRVITQEVDVTRLVVQDIEVTRIVTQVIRVTPESVTKMPSATSPPEPSPTLIPSSTPTQPPPPSETPTPTKRVIATIPPTETATPSPMPLTWVNSLSGNVRERDAANVEISWVGGVPPYMVVFVYQKEFFNSSSTCPHRDAPVMINVNAAQYMIDLAEDLDKNCFGAWQIYVRDSMNQTTSLPHNTFNFCPHLGGANNDC